MIFYSHWLDLIGKLFTASLFGTLLYVTRALDFVQPALARTPNPTFCAILLMGIVLLGFYIAFHVTATYSVLSSLNTYLGS